jgi:hypothetical protein
VKHRGAGAAVAISASQQRGESSVGRGPWSAGIKFLLLGSAPAPTSAPVLTARLGTTEPALPSFSWNSVASAAAYQLWVNDDAGTRLERVFSAEIAGCTNNNPCSVAPNVAFQPGAFTWWVRAQNATGKGPWSNPGTFDVGNLTPPGPATLITPSGTIATRTPTYSWQAVDGATKYEIYTNDASPVDRARIELTSQQAGCDDGVCSTVPATEFVSGPATWWLRESNAAGWGPLGQHVVRGAVTDTRDRKHRLAPARHRATWREKVIVSRLHPHGLEKRRHSRAPMRKSNGYRLSSGLRLRSSGGALALTFVLSGCGESPSETETGQVAAALDTRRFVREAKLEHPESKPGDRFGRSTAISATTLDHQAFIGAASAQGGYRYRNSGNAWFFDGGLFGYQEKPGAGAAVAISPSQTHYLLGNPSEGLVSAYERRFFYTSWTADWKDAFGASTGSQSGCGSSLATGVITQGEVYTRGEFVVVGCGIPGTGTYQAAWVFRRSGDFYVLDQTLRPWTRVGTDHYVASVAVSGEMIALGTPDEGIDSPTDRQGAVSIFQRQGSEWVKTQQLTGIGGTPTSAFGRSVSMSPTHLLVGEASSAHVFVLDGNATPPVWRSQQELVPSDGESGDDFGAAVQVANEWALVGAPGDTVDGNPGQGSVSVFRADGSTWTELQKFVGDPGPQHHFGSSLAFNGAAAIVGAWGEKSDTGAAYAWAPQPPTPPDSAPGFILANAQNTAWPFYTFHRVLRATGYRIQVTGVLDLEVTAAEADCIGIGVGCFIASPIVMPRGTYTWRVQAFNEFGYGPWSSLQEFHVSTSPSVPSVSYPEKPTGSIADTTPEFRFSHSNGATDYTIWVNDASLATTNAKYSMLASFSAAEAGCTLRRYCTFIPTTPLAIGAGTWWVRGENALGSGPWSAGASFLVLGGPPAPTSAPVLTAPLGTTEPALPSFSWNSVPDATTYRLWVNDAAGTRLHQVFTAEIAGCANGALCSVAPNVAFEPGAFRWWVLAQNVSGKGPWSGVGTFNVGN